MSSGPGIVQREILDRLALLHWPALPALWHPVEFRPVLIDVGRTPDGQIGIHPHTSLDRREELLSNLGKVSLLIDDAQGRYRFQNAHQRNRIWWEYDIGRPQRNLNHRASFPVGMLFDKDSRSRRSSVFRAVRQLETSHKLEVERLNWDGPRNIWVRLPSTEADRSATEQMIDKRLTADRRSDKLLDHLSLSHAYLPDAELRWWRCLDGNPCSSARHADLKREVARLTAFLMRTKPVAPRLWRTDAYQNPRRSA